MPTVYLEYKKGTIVPVYICNLDKHDNDLYEKQIRECGDVQSKKTNVKAEMTDWLLTEYESFRNLGIDIVVNHLPHLSKPTVDGSVFDWIITALWGNIYHKGDYTDPHDHMPAAYSFTYYVKVPEGSAPLILDDLGEIWTPKEGDLVLFPAHLKHSVPKHTIDEDRISIAGNLTTAWDIKGKYIYNASDIV